MRGKGREVHLPSTKAQDFSDHFLNNNLIHSLKYLDPSSFWYSGIQTLKSSFLCGSIYLMKRFNKFPFSIRVSSLGADSAFFVDMVPAKWDLCCCIVGICFVLMAYYRASVAAYCSLHWAGMLRLIYLVVKVKGIFITGDENLSKGKQWEMQMHGAVGRWCAIWVFVFLFHWTYSWNELNESVCSSLRYVGAHVPAPRCSLLCGDLHESL